MYIENLWKESYFNKQYASTRLLFRKIVYCITNVINTNSFSCKCCVLANTIHVFIYCFMEINVFLSYLLMFTSYKMCYPKQFVKNIWSNSGTIPINNRHYLKFAICNFFHDLSTQKLESSWRFPFENNIPLLFILIILHYNIG